MKEKIDKEMIESFKHNHGIDIVDEMARILSEEINKSMINELLDNKKNKIRNIKYILKELENRQ